MALSSALNINYRPSSVNVTEKYTPLNNIQVAGPDTPVVQAMIQNRIDAFANMGILVNSLTYLSIETLDDFAALEVGKSPPLVVVSSGRSQWIRARYDNAVGILHGRSNFTGLLDREALQGGAAPIYLPLRMSQAESLLRNVYIFVASDEYNQYREALRGTGITVVGWRTDGEERASGFGASRYAALEFFKYINHLNGACTGMWLFDDNVSYIRAFPGLAAVEGQLGANVGLGFRGGTQAQGDAAFINISADNNLPGPVAANAHIQAPILQQAVLWNVAQFNARAVSFSPFFMTSAEDTSLTSFLGQAVCRFYNGCEVFKGLTVNPGPDVTTGVELLKASKRELLNYCFRVRNPVPFTSGAVPLSLTLAAVITAARDAVASPPRIADIAAQETEAQTYSKAVEQTLVTALNNGVALQNAVFARGPLQITSKRTRRI